MYSTFRTKVLYSQFIKENKIKNTFKHIKIQPELHKEHPKDNDSNEKTIIPFKEKETSVINYL